jgi:hypothetical protein
VFQKNISDGGGSRNESIDTPLYPPLFWLDNIFKTKMHFSFFTQGKNNCVDFRKIFPLENYTTANVLGVLWRRLSQKIHHLLIFGTVFDKIYKYFYILSGEIFAKTRSRK